MISSRVLHLRVSIGADCDSRRCLGQVLQVDVVAELTLRLRTYAGHAWDAGLYWGLTRPETRPEASS